MNLSQLLYKRLSDDSFLSSVLCRFSGAPAIFNTEFPGDQQDGWEGATQYPRISYIFNKQVNTERSASGLLRVAIYDMMNPMEVEKIEDAVKNSLQNVLIKPDEDAPMCFAWARTDPYILEGNAIICREITFDILEYPQQETTDPDPIETMNNLLEKIAPDAFIVGMNRIADFRVATEDSPIIYVRAVSHKTSKTTYALTWINCRLAIHIIAPTTDVRNRWVRYVANWFSTEGEAMMPDNSPLLFEGMSASNNMDYLTSGQIILDTQYALTRMRPEAPPLRHVNFNK